MKFLVNGIEKTVTVKYWDEMQGRYGEDIFYELETSIPQTHKLTAFGDAYIMTNAEFNEMVNYHKKEIEFENESLAQESTGERYMVLEVKE